MKKGFIEPVVHQAFSHMSRMHTSSSAAFFASSFAYLAYLGYYVLNIRQHVLGWDRHVTLLGLPFLAPLFLMARYFSVNIALKGVAEDIRICDHVPNEDSQCDHPTLHQYLSSKYPKLWLAVTQTDSFAYWAILLFALFGVIWFVWIFLGNMASGQVGRTREALTPAQRRCNRRRCGVCARLRREKRTGYFLRS